MLSGDRPETVAAIAREAGVPERGPPLDGSDLPSGLADVIYARWAFAGLGSAARIGARLAASDSSGVLGFDNGFFAVTPASAAGILAAFTVVELLVAVLLLMRRPTVSP